MNPIKRSFSLKVQDRVQLGTLLNFIINWGFWSRETETDYYASLEDGEAYISLTQKEQ